MRNIELKARATDLAHAAAVCQSIGAAFRGEMRQTDTYFVVPEGRLKLRENDPGRCELIYYHRVNVAESRASDYEIAVADAAMKHILERALGVRAVVRKRRALWLWENVRIHLDRVDGLGNFIEFEAVLDDAHDDADGYGRVAFLRDAFAIASGDLVSVSYSDLLLAAQ